MDHSRFDREIHPRCPPLGGPVPFRHCRTSGSNQLCARIAECWWNRPDILRFAREELGATPAPANAPKPKLEQLLEAANRAKQAG